MKEDGRLYEERKGTEKVKQGKYKERTFHERMDCRIYCHVQCTNKKAKNKM